MRKHFTNLLLALFSTLLTLGALEFGTRLIFANECRNFYDHRVAQPEPYQNADYFSKAFIQESIFDQPGKWINIEGTRMIYPTNFAGDFFNVENHLRFTTNAPDSFQNRIHLFGGSTIYNAEVPDNHTVASNLQKKINEKFPNQFRVVNYGVTSINTAQELERLKMVDLQAGDKVVFYGGVNDGLLFTTGRMDGWIMGENHVAYETANLNIVQKIRFKLYHKFRKRSNFIDKFLNPYTYNIPPHLTDSTRVEKMKTELKASYKNSVTEANAFCKKDSVTFYNFLQPTILTRSNRTAYENELLKNYYIIPEVWLLALKYSYDILPEANMEMGAGGILVRDLRDVLDGSRESHFLDYCHITDKGNHLVAEGIFNFIFEQEGDFEF